MIIDYSASIVAGGGLRTRIENTRLFYSEECGAYFDDILSKRGKAFADSACGFLLLDSLLQNYKIDRLTLAIFLDANGRPRTNRSDLDFSISHSEGCAMCAVAVGEGANVGVDVQRERPYSLEKMTELARAFMSDRELAEFTAPIITGKTIPMMFNDKDMADFSDKNREFYTAWTRRESYTKRVGSDIFDNLKTADLSGEHYIEGKIIACGEHYYYSISTPACVLNDALNDDAQSEDGV